MAEVGATDNIGSSLIKSMNVGSGVDISELAEALANADTAPSISTKTTQKEEATAAISGLGILKSSLSMFSQSVDTMTDKSSLTDKSVASQNENRVEAKITAQTKVQAGTHKLQCRQLARAQINELKMASGSFSSDAQALNGGSAFNLSIASPAGGSATTVAVTTATPAGIVDAINAANVNGIRAYTMNMASSGTAISIMIEGKTGVANTFTVTDASSISSPSTLITQDTSNDIQAAADLKLVVNKPSDTSEFVFRDNNSPSDVIAGVQLNFKVADNSDPYTTTNIVIAEDRAAFTTAMTNMQTAYNDLVQTIGVLDGSVESESSYAGNLKKEKSTLRGIVQNIRTALTNDSSTPSDPINSMRQLGVGFDLNGNLTIQRTTLDAAVISNFSDITKMLTANTDDQSSFSSAAKGLAQDVVNVVDNFNGVSGIVSIKTDSNTKLVRDLTTQLEDLQSKYESSRKRYLQQFAAMESLVQSSKSTGDYLTQQFKAMNGDN
jgi:flagellar hook-associated protein 2